MRYILLLTLIIGAPLFGDALQDLKDGNTRFMQKDMRRHKHVDSQHPFCAVLACADSRVAPEIIFDQNLGDLFVARVAGNVMTQGVAESLDFATSVLKVPLIVVVGHQDCGAVEAVMDMKDKSELGTIFSLIQPAIKGDDTLKEAIISNVKAQVQMLQQYPTFNQQVRAKKLRIIGAYYDFETGQVSFF